MEEAQDRDSQPGALGADGARPRARGAALALRYCSCRDAAALAPDTVLGGLAFSSEAPAPGHLADRIARVQMPVLGADDFCAVWMSGTPVSAVAAHGIAGARNGQVLFGTLQLAEEGPLHALSERAYRQVFEFVDELGYPYLLRTWNYFSRINADAAGTERYRRFNAGRHAAFAAKGRVIGENTPAACALGSAGGPLTICFIASRLPGEPLENPRQVSAYRYPRAYGTRSPTFSRGMRVGSGEQSAVLISGTSSIVGHESLHPGDVTAQVKETLTNIEAVLGEAGWSFERLRDGGGKLLLTVYARRRSDVPAIKQALGEALTAPAEIACVQADVCRSELLVEIEAALFPSIKPSPR